jgi:hypothetical protein
MLWCDCAEVWKASYNLAGKGGNGLSIMYVRNDAEDLSRRCCHPEQKLTERTDVHGHTTKQSKEAADVG